MVKAKFLFRISFVVFLLLPLSMLVQMSDSAIPDEPGDIFSPLAVADAYEDDDTFETATTIALGTEQNHSIYPIADPDFLVFELDSFYKVSIKIQNASGDTRMWLYDIHRNQLAFDEDNGPNDLNSTINFAMLRSGFYFIKIEESGNDAEIDTYLVSVTATLLVDEYEDDGSGASAVSLIANSSIIKSISPADDHDFFEFTIGVFTDIDLETYGGDTQMLICTDASNIPSSIIGLEDDDGGTDGGSKITIDDLEPGTYYVRVRGYNSATVIGSYYLNFMTHNNTLTDTTAPLISGINAYKTKQYSNAVTISSTITDTCGISEANVTYRVNSGSWQNVTNVNVAMQWYYNVSIGPYNEGDVIEYYFTAVDNSTNHNTAIYNNSGSYYSYTIIHNDFEGPTIEDVGNFPSSPNDTESIKFNCTATDQNGINFVALYYRINGGGGWNSIQMNLASGNSYEVTFGSMPYGTLFEYYIQAWDDSTQHNSAINDNGGIYYNFTVAASDVTGPIITDVEQAPVSPTDVETIVVSCSVTDSSGIQSVTLIYRDNSGSWTETAMSLSTGSTYDVTIGAFDYDDVIEYYINASDNYVTHNFAINDNGGLYYSFTIGASDNTAPTISNILHDPPSPNDLDTIRINCTVTDASGIYSVTLHYRLNGGSWTSSAMINTVGNIYSINIGTLAYDDFFEYYIRAVDNYVTRNTATDDNSGAYYSFTVGASDTIAPIIADILHTPSSPNDIETVTFSCTATDASGISSVLLYYRINGGSWTSIAMINTVDDTYAVDLGPFDYTDEIEYYIFIEDNYVVPNSATDDNSGTYYSFTIVCHDVILPVISDVNQDITNPTHTQSVNISCIVSDASGLSIVLLYYRVEGNDWNYVQMNYLQDDTYFVILGPFTEGFLIEYYIQALDNSAANNEAIDDNSGSYYSYTVESIVTPPPGTITITPPPVTITINETETVTQNETVTTTLESGVILITTIGASSIGLIFIVMIYRKRRQ